MIFCLQTREDVEPGSTSQESFTLDVRKPIGQRHRELALTVRTTGMCTTPPRSGNTNSYT